MSYLAKIQFSTIDDEKNSQTVTYTFPFYYTTRKTYMARSNLVSTLQLSFEHSNYCFVVSRASSNFMRFKNWVS